MMKQSDPLVGVAYIKCFGSLGWAWRTFALSILSFCGPYGRKRNNEKLELWIKFVYFVMFMSLSLAFPSFILCNCLCLYYAFFSIFLSFGELLQSAWLDVARLNTHCINWVIPWKTQRLWSQQQTIKKKDLVRNCNQRGINISTVDKKPNTQYTNEDGPTQIQAKKKCRLVYFLVW